MRNRGLFFAAAALAGMLLTNAAGRATAAAG